LINRITGGLTKKSPARTGQGMPLP